MAELEDELGDIIEKARDGKQWSQNDLSRATGIGADKIRQLENYEWIPEDSDIEVLAGNLNLHAPALIAIAHNRWSPRPSKSDADRPFELVCLNVFMGAYPVKCYLLICKETRTAAIIDTGANPKALIKKAEELRLFPSKILLTHTHPDHAGGLGILDHEFNCPTWVGANEPRPSGSRNLQLVHDGDVIPLGRLNVECLSTPGHTAGGISYKVGDILISGDTLFAGSMGRANSSWQDLYDSITQKVLTLPAETELHPGHGPATTVGEETRHNPFFCDKV